MALASSIVSLAPALQTAVGQEVSTGLSSSPKTLSPWLFYDEEGSRLFEQITQLPEYYVTRTERGIFARHADEILALAAEDSSLAVLELGAGTASKTGLLLAAAVRRQVTLDYFPIDVSETALADAKAHLEQQLPGVSVHPRVADYTDGLGRIDTGSARRLVLYIGSSIGNFEPADAVELLRNVRAELAPGDRLLLGVDLVKPLPLLKAAYDDAARVTAAFNKNMLVRINRELGADFRLDAFVHRAVWNARHARIEMHLESQVAQRVRIPGIELEVSFRSGETIHTENSYKFTDARILAILEGAGFGLRRTWKDERDWFGVYLASVC